MHKSKLRVRQITENHVQAYVSNQPGRELNQTDVERVVGFRLSAKISNFKLWVISGAINGPGLAYNSFCEVLVDNLICHYLKTDKLYIKQ